jgi:plastocyanin
MDVRRSLIRFSPWLVLATLLVFSFGSATVASAARATVNVEMGDNFFRPDSVTVAVGDTVVWTHTGNRPHDVTADNGAFSSPRRMSNGQTFSFTATTAGTYTYVCTIHPNQMRATLVVQGAGGAGGAAAMPRTGGGGMAADAEADGTWWALAGLSLAGVVVWAVGTLRRRSPA